MAVLAAVTLTATAIAPLPASASCMPPDMQAFSGDPDVVVVAGHVTDVRDGEVDFDVQLYWGPEPRRIVTIARPEADPTVMTSADWSPQVGEPWIIVAARDGERLRTETCMQLPGTREAEAQVRSSLGEPVRPAVDSEPGAAATDGGSATASPSASAPASPDGGAAIDAPGDASQDGAPSSPGPVLGLAALVLGVAVALGLMLRRRTAG